MLKTLVIIRWALVAALVFVLAAPALAVSLGGRLIVEVDGASMTPTYQIGDVIVVREPTKADLVVGNVVTAVDGNGDYYTHRIETVNDDGSLGLKGDGNEASDPGTVTLEQLRGVVELHLGQPWANLIMQLQQWPLRICLLAVILGLALLPFGGRRSETTPAQVAGFRTDARRHARGALVPSGRGRRSRSAGWRPDPRVASASASETAIVPSAASGGAGEVGAAPIPSSMTAPGYAISVVDGPDGQPRVRVSVDLDSLALATALTVATPGPVAAPGPAAGTDAVDADDAAPSPFPSRSMPSVHVTAGVTSAVHYTRVRGRRPRHGRRRAT